jgi:hypothetical protein
MGIGAIADRRSRQQPKPRHSPDTEPNSEGQDEGSRRRGAQHEGTNAVPDATIPAETLFTTAQMATEMLPSSLSPNEIKLRNSQNWLPPYSALRLRDKLI